MSIASALKLATPATAAVLIVPTSTAPAVPVPPAMLIVTLFVAVATVLPPASTTATTTAGAMAVSELAAVGPVTISSPAGAPALMLKATLVALVSSALDATRV